MGWQRGLVVACVVAWAAACRGGDDGGGGGGGPGGHCARRLVADRDELPPLLAELSWTSVGPYGPRDRLAITDDLWTTAEIVLERRSLDEPLDCAVRLDCRHEVRFLMEEPAAGVTLEGTAGVLRAGRMRVVSSRRAPGSGSPGGLDGGGGDLRVSPQHRPAEVQA